MFDDSALSIYSFDWEKSIDRYFLKLSERASKSLKILWVNIF